LLLFLVTPICALGLNAPSTKDISASDLKTASVPASLQARILALPTQQRIKLKADLSAINTQLQRSNAKWTAGYTPQMMLPASKRKALCGLSLPSNSELATLNAKAAKSSVLAASALAAASPPVSFDWRNRHGKNYLTPVKDQGVCGSCWAFAANAALEGSINAYYNQPGLSSDLSPQDMITCYKADGCCGATVFEIDSLYGTFLKNTGVCGESCFDYMGCDSFNEICPGQENFGDSCSGTVSCSSKCGSQATSWKISDYHMIALNKAELKKALMAYGPLETGMYVYSDLYSYTGGIYKYTYGTLEGGHAVTIVGWGSSGGQEYWIVKNSWGPGWGEGGYFKIAMGDSKIDSWFVFAAERPIPVIGSPPQPLCEDVDGDGYCNWGLGPRPANCHATCSTIEDPDDSNPLMPTTTTTTTTSTSTTTTTVPTTTTSTTTTTTTATTSTTAKTTTTKTTRTTTTKTTRTTTTTIQPTCDDPDKGQDFYSVGTVTAVSARGKVTKYADQCHVKLTRDLFEAYCSAKNTLYKKLVVCPNTCLDGACVVNREPICSHIGTPEEGWYKDGVSLEATDCEGCIAKCMYPKKTNEGWYSSCGKRLITLEKCTAIGPTTTTVTTTVPTTTASTTTTTLASNCELCTPGLCGDCASGGGTCFANDAATECFATGEIHPGWTECCQSP
jgi:C1A family cysteine protease